MLASRSTVLHRFARSTARAVIAIALLVGAVLTAPVAQAQPADDILVPPISSREFYRYARMLQLEHQQLIAAEAAHETYKDRYRELRDREVQRFMKRMRELEGMGGDIPSRETVEEFFRDRRNVRDRFRTLDLQFFNALDPIVRPEQRQRLERVKKLREREYFRLGAQMQQTQQIELLDLVARLDLSPEDEAAIDPILIAWENSYTTKMRDAEEKSLEGIVKMLDAMAMMQGGFEFDENTSQEEMMAMQQAAQETMAKAMEPARQASADAYTITKSSAAQIEASLPKRAADSFRRMVQAQLYPSFFPDGTSLERVFEEALRREEFSAHRDKIAQLQTGYLAEKDSINRRLIEAQEALDKKNAGGPFGGFDHEAWQAHWQLVQEMQQKRQEVANSYDEQLQNLLGEEGFQTLNGLRGPSPQEMRAMSDESDGVEIAGNIEGVAVEISDVSYGLHDGYLPRAISEEDVHGWASRLRATDDQRDIIALLHQDYLAQYRETAQNEVARIMEPAQRAFNDPPVEAQDMERLSAARTQARAALGRVDQTFLESVGSLLSPDQQKHFEDVKVSRERAIERSAAFGWEYRATTDPVLLFTRLRPDEAGWQAASKAIAEYERESIPLLKQRATIAMQRDVINHRSAALYESGQPDMQALQAHQENWMAVENKINEVDNRITELSEQATEEVAAALPPDLAERFRDEVRRATYPEVYPDPADATPVLERALTLRDLTDSQRARIEVLRADHADAHRRLSDELIDFTRADRAMRMDNAPRMMDGEEGESWMERMTRQEQVRYDRRELSATTLRRLRTILTAEQCERLPAMSLKEE